MSALAAGTTPVVCAGVPQAAGDDQMIRRHSTQLTTNYWSQRKIYSLIWPLPVMDKAHEQVYGLIASTIMVNA